MKGKYDYGEFNTLAKLLVTKYNLRKEDKHGIMEAIGNVLRDIALPLGIGVSVGRQIR